MLKQCTSPCVESNLDNKQIFKSTREKTLNFLSIFSVENLTTELWSYEEEIRRCRPQVWEPLGVVLGD